MMDYAEKMRRCHEYVEALEEEKRKIQVFQRELPLCLELVTQAIDACRRELSGTTTEYMHGQSECSEQTSSDGPILEEFIPLKRSPSGDDNDTDNDERHSNKPATATTTNNNREKEKNSDKKKSDWLRSVQLWNQSPDPPPKEEEVVPRKATVVEVNRNGNGGAFQPFHREKGGGQNEQQQRVGKISTSVPTAAASSTTDTVVSKGEKFDKDKDKDKESQAQRKQRRCWSPELHRRFLHALQQLGGSHTATPKQIRELMKVDGLTNDEVKSHLQKYRLHTRRPSPAMHNSGNPQAPQFVVVGGIWVPPPEYAAVAAKTPGEAGSIATSNGIYAPVAAPPPALPQSSASVVQRSQQTQSEHLHSEERGSHSDGGHHANSPATSSSTHTTTASPAF